MLFHTRRLKGDGFLARGGDFSARAISHISNKTKFFKRMARAIDPDAIERLSEKRAMKNALLAMAENKKGITTQDVADQLVKWRYQSGDQFNREETRSLTRDFQKMGVAKWELRKARKNYFREKAKEKRNKLLSVKNERETSAHHKETSDIAHNGAKSFLGESKVQMAKIRGDATNTASTANHPILERIRESLRRQPPSPPSAHIPRRPLF